METPFIFGKIATEKNFTDREMETANLVQNFTSLINTIIISPRRWGKSSLVNKAAKLAMEQDNNLRICHIDLFNVRNEEHFYSLLAQKVIAATSTKWEEAVENAKSFFSHLVPKISIGTDPTNEVSIDFDWDDVKRNPDEVLDLAEKIAQKKGLKIVICVDEFQNIAEFTDPDYFQKKLRSHWQQHQSVAYCLYGSKRHMMMEVFTNSSKPFYKFGNLMFLNKIDTPYLVEFFNSRFEDTGKKINEEAANLIVELVDNHPYYAQQLAQQSWLRTK
ncbi:MAG: ATP-binding protein, partial [Alphaproteobacteria bacterium]|nr:ATP-binding protein [Alphaproteobacteria bacterium]